MIESAILNPPELEDVSNTSSSEIANLLYLLGG